MNLRGCLCWTLLFCSCSCRERPGGWIASKLEDHCKTYPCTIAMADIITEPWASFYVFKPGFSGRGVDGALSYAYKYGDGDAERFVFVKNGFVTYHLEEYEDPEEPEAGGVHIDIVGTAGYKVYSRKAAVFSVRPLNYRRGVSYLLGDFE